VQIENVFSGEPATGMREAAAGLIKRLAQTAKDTFGDFEDAVEKDATKTPVLDGTVHPLTSYVINYVKFLFDYQSTLSQLFGDGELAEKSHLAAATMRIMSVLQTNLDGKSKLYKDPALTQLFLMNNIHYMVKSVRRSEAKDMLGDDWVQRQRRIVQQHATGYRRAAWTKVLSYITSSGSMSSSSGVGSGDSGGISKTQIKERCSVFILWAVGRRIMLIFF
jgi:exocyst complex protein 7